MQLNPEKQPPNLGLRQSRPVGPFITQVLESYQSTLHRHSISLELDFDPLVAWFDSSLVRKATQSLLDNAIASMPNGGEISITLIDGDHQWELEIADTKGMAFNSFQVESPNEDTDLPMIIPFPETELLRTAHRAALDHGGHVQTWNCPQGGTAHALVIPKRSFGTGGPYSNSRPQQF